MCKTFPPVYNSAKILKIHQDFPELWSQMFATFLWFTVCIYIYTHVTLTVMWQSHFWWCKSATVMAEIVSSMHALVISLKNKPFIHTGWQVVFCYILTLSECVVHTNANIPLELMISNSSISNPMSNAWVCWISANVHTNANTTTATRTLFRWSAHSHQLS